MRCVAALGGEENGTAAAVAPAAKAICAKARLGHLVWVRGRDCLVCEPAEQGKNCEGSGEAGELVPAPLAGNNSAEAAMLR